MQSNPQGEFLANVTERLFLSRLLLQTYPKTKDRPATSAADSQSLGRFL